MKTYEGTRNASSAGVHFKGLPPDPRYDLRKRSPARVEWGHDGSGPAQLALALLADHFSDDARALQLAPAFKWALVAKLPRSGWTLTSDEIARALLNLKS